MEEEESSPFKEEETEEACEIQIEAQQS